MPGIYVENIDDRADDAYDHWRAQSDSAVEQALEDIEVGRFDSDAISDVLVMRRRGDSRDRATVQAALDAAQRKAS